MNKIGFSIVWILLLAISGIALYTHSADASAHYRDKNMSGLEMQELKDFIFKPIANAYNGVSGTIQDVMSTDDNAKDINTSAVVFIAETNASVGIMSLAPSKEKQKVSVTNKAKPVELKQMVHKKKQIVKKNNGKEQL